MKGDGRALLILLVACLILFSFHLASRDLWEPDEPRYAGIARGILESGDWLNLTDNGLPYTDKPPLFFWILAAAGRLGSGVTALTSRIPSSLLALCAVLLLFRLGRDLFNGRVGMFGALVLATSQRFFLEARWVHMDMLVTLVVLAALDAAYRALEKGERWRWWVAYGALGLGALAKGPVVLAVPAAALITFLATTRELPRLKETRAWLGIPLALLPVGLWLWASSASAGFDPVEVVRTQVLRRFQEGIHHPRPFYYYAYSLPLGFLPWTPFLPGIFVATFPRRGAERRRQRLFLYAWLIGGFAFFSVAAEKRPSYLLPVYPPLALLAGAFLEEYLARWNAEPLRKWLSWPLLLYAAILSGGLLAIPFATRNYPGLGERVAALALLYLAACAGALTALRLGRRGVALLILLSGFWAGYLGIAGSLLPWLNDYKSARPFCERVVSRVGQAPLGIYGDYHPAYAFYTHRNLKVIQRPEELAASTAGGGIAAWFMKEEDFLALRSRLPLKELDRERVGHRTMLLVSSVPAPP